MSKTTCGSDNSVPKYIQFKNGSKILIDNISKEYNSEPLRGYGKPPFIPTYSISDETLRKIILENFKIIPDTVFHLFSTPKNYHD